MFLHLGADKMVKLKDVIAVINMENSIKSNNNNILKNFKIKNNVEKIEENDCKSIIITNSKIYYSPISSQTLKKRASFIAKLGEK